MCGAATVIGVAGVQVASAELTAPAGPTSTTVDTAKSGDGADVGPRGPRGKKGKRGPRGPTGPTGPTGPAGPSVIPMSGVAIGGLPLSGADRIFFPGGNLSGDLIGGFASAPVALVIRNFEVTRPGGAAFTGDATYSLVVDTDGDPTVGPTPAPAASCSLTGAPTSCTMTPAQINIPAGVIYYFLVPGGNGFGPGSAFSYLLSVA